MASNPETLSNNKPLPEAGHELALYDSRTGEPTLNNPMRREYVPASISRGVNLVELGAVLKANGYELYSSLTGTVVIRESEHGERARHRDARVLHAAHYDRQNRLARIANGLCGLNLDCQLKHEHEGQCVSHAPDSYVAQQQGATR